MILGRTQNGAVIGWNGRGEVFVMGANGDLALELQAEVERRFEEPFAVPISNAGDDVIEETAKLDDPGTPEHARAVMRDLGVVEWLIDDANEPSEISV